MLSDGAQRNILLHIDAPPKTLRHEVEVNAKAPCQVDKRLTIRTPATDHPSLVASCLLRRTLLHVQMGRIDNTFYRCPRWQLPSGRLPASNLSQGRRHIYFLVLCSLQSQPSHVVSPMLANEIPCLLVDKHNAKIQIIFKLSTANEQLSIKYRIFAAY